MRGLRPDTLGHLRNFAGSALAVNIIAIVNKGAIDFLMLVAVAWFAVSVTGVLRTDSAGSFVNWNVILLLSDAVLDIAVMGTHLPAWLADGALIPWNFDTGRGWIIAYWVLLWGIAIPNRTLAMADRAAIPPAAAAALVVTVIGLHITFVEDVIYFTLLGYPPLISTPPENYAYLPQYFGLGVWTAPKVWVISAIGTLAFAITSAIVVSRTGRSGEPGRGSIRSRGSPPASDPSSKARS